MKIVIIHYRYYIAGGPERYLFNVKSVLEANGHEVIPFSMDYSRNTDSKYSEYFADAILGRDEFHLHKMKNVSFTDKVKVLSNLFYNTNAKQNLEKLLDDVKPDVAYVLQYWGKLSPSIFDACYSKKVPVVLRMSDFNLLCPKNTFYRDNKVCTKCLETRLNSVRYKCIHNSFFRSAINLIAFKATFNKSILKTVDCFIAPTKFMKSLFERRKDFKGKKIAHVPTLVEKKAIISEKELIKSSDEESYCNLLKLCYIGRIESEKGVDILVKAVHQIKRRGFNVQLNIIGAIESDYAHEVKDYCTINRLDCINFEGFLNKEEILVKLRSSHYSVVPSVCFDNMPNSLLESQSQGIPVLAPNIGSFQELITNGVNGYIFEAGNFESLSDLIESLYKIPFEEYYDHRLNSVKWIHSFSTEEIHYNRIISIFEEQYV